MKSLQEKLHPGRFSDMSPKMAAFTGYIIGCAWTEPTVGTLAVTSDGFLVGRHSTPNGLGYSELWGTYSDLARNWDNLLEAADLTEEEREAADLAFNQRVTASGSLPLKERK